MLNITSAIDIYINIYINMRFGDIFSLEKIFYHFSQKVNSIPFGLWDRKAVQSP